MAYNPVVRAGGAGGPGTATTGGLNTGGATGNADSMSA
jgi:hypothetical protein